MLTTKLVEFAQSKGWANIVAKRKNGEQSLLEHSLVSRDCGVALASTLKPFIQLSSSEFKIIETATFLHDSAKMTDDFQAYILGKKTEFVSDIQSAFDEQIIREFNSFSKARLSESEIQQVLSAICLHMKNAATNGNVLSQLISNSSNNARWAMLTDIVKITDHVSSARTFENIKSVIDTSIFSKYIKVEKYDIDTTSLFSSSFAIKAVNKAFIAKGFTPLIYLPNTGIFIGKHSLVAPNKTEIRNILDGVIDEYVTSHRQSFINSVVGNDVTRTFYNRDLFSFSMLRPVMLEASTKVKAETFVKKEKEYQDAIILAVNPNYDTERREEFVIRISLSYPLIPVVRIFKEIHKKENIFCDVSESYEEDVFGIMDNFFKVDGIGKRIMSTSVFNPRVDSKLIMDIIQALELSAVRNSEELLSAFIDAFEQISLKIQGTFLVQQDDFTQEYVTRVLDMVSVSSDSKGEKTMDSFFDDMAENHKGSIFSGKDFTCPSCNHLTKVGRKINYNYFERISAFNSRGKILCSRGDFYVCEFCFYERVLGELYHHHQDIIVVNSQINQGNGYNKFLQAHLRDTVQSLAKTVNMAEKSSVKSIRDLKDILDKRVSTDTINIEKLNLSTGMEFETEQDILDFCSENDVDDNDLLDAFASLNRNNSADVFINPHFSIIPLTINEKRNEGITNQALKKLFVSLYIADTYSQRSIVVNYSKIYHAVEDDMEKDVDKNSGVASFVQRFKNFFDKTYSIGYQVPDGKLMPSYLVHYLVEYLTSVIFVAPFSKRERNNTMLSIAYNQNFIQSFFDEKAIKTVV